MRRGGLIVGGVSFLGAGIATFLANRKAQETENTVKNAIEGLTKEGAAVPSGTGITIPVRCTGYWPFQEGLTPAQRLMEGGHNDRTGKRLQTLEDFQAGKVDYVSVAGDWTIWPYGQRISLPMWPGVVFRIVDTGGNFFGVKKVYRVTGREPLDICVASHATKVYALQDATVYPGDHFGHRTGPKQVAFQKIGKPVVGCCGLDLLGVG
jgi:hypothetical protein